MPQSREPRITRTIDVGPVWAGHPVGFCLLNDSPNQYVAYYDADRWLTVAKRELSSDQWQFIRLPERIGWDSHNYVTMAIDDDGLIHLSGNMHAEPLVYYRTTKPRDIATFERIHQMVGAKEYKCTYPSFMRGPANEFIFTYREGWASAGDQIYNVYDHATRAWSRLIDRPFTDGEGVANAYFCGPQLGPDGYYHLTFVWRTGYGAGHNQDVCYARSKDLVNWENSAGLAYELPITAEAAEKIDPVPVLSGLINGNHVIGFDSRKRPIVSYHKFDASGNTQLYSARLEDGEWKIYQSSNWDYRWWFDDEPGSIAFEIQLGSVAPCGEGRLAQTWYHVKYGTCRWLLDESTLKPVEVQKDYSALPQSLLAMPPSGPDLQVSTFMVRGSGSEAGKAYVLRWETLGVMHDLPRDLVPEPTMMKLYEISVE